MKTPGSPGVFCWESALAPDPIGAPVSPTGCTTPPKAAPWPKCRCRGPGLGRTLDQGIGGSYRHNRWHRVIDRGSGALSPSSSPLPQCRESLAELDAVRQGGGASSPGWPEAGLGPPRLCRKCGSARGMSWQRPFQATTERNWPSSGRACPPLHENEIDVFRPLAPTTYGYS
jgi:hypothetical protein